MAKRGAPRKYKTPGALRRAVDAYFASISYTRNVVIYRQEIGVNQKTGDPELKKIPEELRDENGNYVLETVWLEEPSKAALCIYLGISADTWSRYAKEGSELKPVTDYVDLVMLKRLSYLLNTRNSVQGIVFNLKANYGWTDRVEVTHRGNSLEEYLAELEKRQEGGFAAAQEGGADGEWDQ